MLGTSIRRAPGTHVAVTGSGADPLAVGVGDGARRGQPHLAADEHLDGRVRDVGALVDAREDAEELDLARPCRAP